MLVVTCKRPECNASEPCLTSSLGKTPQCLLNTFANGEWRRMRENAFLKCSGAFIFQVDQVAKHASKKYMYWILDRGLGVGAAIITTPHDVQLTKLYICFIQSYLKYIIFISNLRIMQSRYYKTCIATLLVYSVFALVETTYTFNKISVFYWNY